MSGIPPNAPWRGCASSFPLPLNPEDVGHAEIWTRTLQQYNLDDNIVYRPGDREYDILHRVFRWNSTNYQQVFENGFRARDRENTPHNVYYNLEHHVRRGGRPGSRTPRIPHVFVSTTLNSGFYPPIYETSETMYRYEIYAPGGIWVAQTLDRYRYPRQDEVAFVGGISPQHIRSAQLFRTVYDSSRGRRIWEPRDTQLIINHDFNPQLLDIQDPVVDHWDSVCTSRVPLEFIFYEPPRAERRKREVFAPTDRNVIHWYAEDVANIETYINAAFRSSRENEVYLFMKSEYVLVNYAPGTKDDKVMHGPHLICDGFPSLIGTAFAEHGIDCSFGSHDENEAFIFSGNLCARINYAPGTTDDCIGKGPTTIAKMFPFLKGTVFENGVDASFESTTRYEAYLFKDNHYALIIYGSDDAHLIAIRLISEGFASLKGTIFESGFDAAFASHRHNEAYIFKGDSYALINFAPGTTDDYIIGGVKKILPNWPSLGGTVPIENHGADVRDHILPHRNRGLDVNGFTTTPDSDDDHDEI